MKLASRILAAGALGAGLVALPAVADSGDWYGGASNGFRGLSPDSRVFEGALNRFAVSLFGGNLDEALIEKQYAGYRFGDLFALEGTQSQLSLPAFACTHEPLGGDLAEPCFGASWSVSGIANLPFYEGLSVYGRLGLQYWQRNRPGESSPSIPNAQDMSTMYGIGLSYELRKDWYVHAESERFSDLLQGTGLQLNQGFGLESAVHSIGLSIRF